MKVLIFEKNLTCQLLLQTGWSVICKGKMLIFIEQRVMDRQ